jgi:hypothetical protein
MVAVTLFLSDAFCQFPTPQNVAELPLASQIHVNVPQLHLQPQVMPCLCYSKSSESVSIWYTGNTTD